MKFKELQNELKTKIDNVYLIKGDEPYCFENALKQITKCAGENLDQVVFNDENFKVENILLACEQLPFFADKKIVIIKNINKPLTKNEEEKLNKYCAFPNPSTILIMIDENKVFSNINATIIECPKLAIFEVSEIIKNHFGDKVKVSIPAVELLCEFCAGGVNQILVEVEKMSFYSKEITPEIVTKLVPKNLDYQVFELTNCLMSKNVDKALLILEDMIKNKDSYGVLGLITSHYKKMYFSLITPLSNSEIASYFGVKEFAITKAKQNAERYKVKQLKQIYEMLEEVDYMIKSGQMLQNNALYYAIFKILAI